MKKLFGIVLFSVVGILLISGVGVTIIDDVSDNIVSQENNTSERYIIRNGATDLTVTYEGNGSFRFNSESLTPIYQTAIICDGMMIVFSGSETGSCLLRDLQNGVGATINPNTGDEIFTISDGTYGYSYGGTTYTGETETILYPSARGDYGSYTGAFNMSVGDVAYTITTGGITAIMKIKNGASDGYLMKPASMGSGSVLSEYTGTFTPAITSSLNEDGKSYNIESVSFTTDADPQNARMIFAPIWYDVVDTNAQAVKDVVGVIPIILILILVVGVAYGLMSYVKGGRSEL